MYHAKKHIEGRQYWEFMYKVGKDLRINYLANYIMRKTGAYRVYQQTNHNIASVKKFFHYNFEQMTPAYLGLDQEKREVF